MVLRLGIAMMLLAGGCSGTPAAEPWTPDDGKQWEITFGYAGWDDLGKVEPAPVDFIAEQSGRFRDRGFGMEIAYHAHRSDHGRARFLLGGELAGYGFNNERRFTGYHVITGEPASIRMEASWGHVTFGARWIWRSGHRVQLVGGGGAGAYLIRFNEVIDDFGVVDRGESDASFGGYVLAGVRVPVRDGGMAVRMDVRAHWFRFDAVGGAFAGQEMAGPVTLLQFGMEF